MKKNLNIVMNGETQVLDQVSMDDLQRLPPIESRSGRIGYVHVFEEGEELRKPQFKIGTYENGTFIPQAH